MNSSVVFTKLLVKELLNTGLTDQVSHDDDSSQILVLRK